LISLHTETLCNHMATYARSTGINQSRLLTRLLAHSGVLLQLTQQVHGRAADALPPAAAAAGFRTTGHGYPDNPLKWMDMDDHIYCDVIWMWIEISWKGRCRFVFPLSLSPCVVK
jgi:hypothetical protein